MVFARSGLSLCSSVVAIICFVLALAKAQTSETDVPDYINNGTTPCIEYRGASFVLASAGGALVFDGGIIKMSYDSNTQDFLQFQLQLVDNVTCLYQATAQQQSRCVLSMTMAKENPRAWCSIELGDATNFTINSTDDMVLVTPDGQRLKGGEDGAVVPAPVQSQSAASVEDVQNRPLNSLVSENAKRVRDAVGTIAARRESSQFIRAIELMSLGKASNTKEVVLIGPNGTYDRPGAYYTLTQLPGGSAREDKLPFLAAYNHTEDKEAVPCFVPYMGSHAYLVCSPVLPQTPLVVHQGSLMFYNESKGIQKLCAHSDGALKPVPLDSTGLCNLVVAPRSLFQPPLSPTPPPSPPPPPLQLPPSPRERLAVDGTDTLDARCDNGTACGYNTNLKGSTALEWSSPPVYGSLIAGILGLSLLAAAAVYIRRRRSQFQEAERILMSDAVADRVALFTDTPSDRRTRSDLV